MFPFSGDTLLSHASGGLVGARLHVVASRALLAPV